MTEEEINELKVGDIITISYRVVRIDNDMPDIPVQAVPISRTHNPEWQERQTLLIAGKKL